MYRVRLPESPEDVRPRVEDIPEDLEKWLVGSTNAEERDLRNLPLYFLPDRWVRHNYNGAKMKGSYCEGMAICQVTLNKADLRCVNFRNVRFSSVYLKGADLSGADFTGASAVFSRTDTYWLAEAIIEGACFPYEFVEAGWLSFAIGSPVIIGGP